MEKTWFWKKETILLVEDDGSVVNYFRCILPEEKYLLYTTDNGEEAIELIEGIDFDIIILDFHLKGEKNGFDILKACRHKTTAKIYSNTGSPEHSAKMALLGCDQALHKNSYIIHRALGLEIGEKGDFQKREGHIEKALEDFDKACTKD